MHRSHSARWPYAHLATAAAIVGFFAVLAWGPSVPVGMTLACVWMAQTLATASRRVAGRHRPGRHRRPLHRSGSRVRPVIPNRLPSPYAA